IAVGMSSDLVSHNFTEVAAAINYYLDNKNCTTLDLMQFIKGPDFPTGGQIINGEELYNIYSIGRGSVKMRPHYDIVKKGVKTQIIFHDLPYGVEIDGGVKAPLKKLVIEDSITLKKQSNIYWNWYVQVKNDKNDKTFTAGNIEIFTDGEYEYAIVTRNGKKFKVSFETDSPYSLKVQKAEYYVNVDPDPNGTKHSFETSRRLAVQFENVSGTVNLKTIVESMD
ncbi:MAG: hypothetical protein J6R68_01785, partial [Clostridia bacterium]|nr:hypothetical protein [Clostridia bacterium]